jgi:hypothetical protein
MTFSITIYIKHDTQHNGTKLYGIQPSVIMLNVVILSAIMLNVVILSAIMLNVVILSVIMLSVVAPLEIHQLILMPLDETSLFYFRQSGTFHQQSGAKKLLSSSWKTPGDKSYKTFFVCH